MSQQRVAINDEEFAASEVPYQIHIPAIEVVIPNASLIRIISSEPRVEGLPL